MSHNWADDRINDYRSGLAPNDLSDFNERYEDALDELSKEEIRDELVANFERSEDHLELVVQTASAFDQDSDAEGSQSGYEFAFTEPLEELNHIGKKGVSNGDVLLIKEQSDAVYICIIECKSGSSSGIDWIEELRGIEASVSEYSDDLLSQIGCEDKEIRHEQYVLLGTLFQIHRWNYEYWDNEEDISGDYTFWGYSFDEMSLVEVWGQSSDRDLARVVNDGIDTGLVENPIEFTFSDHPLSKFKIILSKIIRDNQRSDDLEPFEFNQSEFYDIFEAQLQVGFEGDKFDKFVSDEVNWLLTLGNRIGILTDENESIHSNRDYRIQFRGQKATVAQEVVEEKYFDVIAEERWKMKAIKQVLEEFTPSQSRLTEFTSDAADIDLDLGI